MDVLGPEYAARLLPMLPPATEEDELNIERNFVHTVSLGDNVLCGAVRGSNESEPATHLIFNATTADGQVLVLIERSRLADRAQYFSGIDGTVTVDYVVDMLDLLPFAVAANPLDVTAQITSVKNGTVRALDIMLSRSSYGTTLAYLASAGLTPASFKNNYAQPFKELKARHPARDVIVVTLSVPEVDRELEKIGIPVFNDATRATLALGAAATIRARWADLYEIRDTPSRARELGDVSTEALAKQALADAGLPVPQEILAIDADAAVVAADTIGYPVVLKVVSRQILHKTELGGVVLDVKCADAVRAAHQQILDRVNAHAPHAQIDGILVCPMIVGGTEMILGVSNDATFGPMLLVGAGGINTELYKDVSLASAPLTQTRARQTLDKVKATALLKGWRGSTPRDTDALVKAMIKLSGFAMCHPEIVSVDVNPLVVHESGVAVLDAVIIKQPAASF